MIEIGVIVNPASGKDIRRVIASGSVVTNQEKINAVIRMIVAMDALGVDLVTILPDPTHIAQRVMGELSPDLTHARVRVLDLPYVMGDASDSLRGAHRMVEKGMACILVLGGDGTSRIVAKASAGTPLLPISTGTNNVFPRMVEGTLAGLAAAHLAVGRVSPAEVCRRAPRLELVDGEGRVVDIALVDVAVLNARDPGSRAVWEHESIRELFLTRGDPSTIGLSAIGGWLAPGSGRDGDEALHVEMTLEGGTPLLAPIAPGLVRQVRVRRHRVIRPGDTVALSPEPGVIALDGEREVLMPDGHGFGVRLSREGPLVLELDRCLQLAAQRMADERDPKADSAPREL